MKTIFQIITSINMGGAENISISLCTYIKENKINCNPVIFEIYRSESNYALQKKNFLRENGIEYHTLGFRNKYLSLLVAPFKLYAYIRKYKPETLHSHTDLPDFVLALSLIFLSKTKFKIIRTIHNTELWPTHSMLGRLTENRFTKDTIVAVSKSALNAYNRLRIKYNLKPSENQQIIYNGIKRPEHYKHDFQIDPQKINIVFGGRLELQKGIDVLIEVIEQLPSYMSKRFLFHIIGDGPFSAKVHETSTKYSHCIYYGSVSDLAHKLYPFDYLIMPSRFEGFGLISLEASLSGIPAIITKIPGLSETLPENWPLFINKSDASEIVEMLKRITTIEYNRDDLKVLAQLFTSQKFSYTKMGKEYASLFFQSQ